MIEDRGPGYSDLYLARRAQNPAIEVMPGLRWYLGTDRRAEAKNMWMSRTVSERELGISPVHHHAESEACIYVLSGVAAFFWGSDLRQHAEVREGDFLFIPAWTIHAEAVASAEPCDMIMARSTADPRSVNRHDLHVPEDILALEGLSASPVRSALMERQGG